LLTRIKRLLISYITYGEILLICICLTILFASERNREKKKEQEREHYLGVTLCEISTATLRAAIYSQARLSSLTANSRLRSKLRLEILRVTQAGVIVAASNLGH